MQKASQNRSSLFPVFATVLLASLAGCTTSGTENGANSSLPTKATSGEKRISETELRAYCPSVSLRDGTAFFNTYEKGGDKDPERVIYQAALTDTTRSCQYGNGTLTMDIAGAGKVVPGPKYKTGTIVMPIRVAIRQGDQVVYSKLHKQRVSITNPDTATQFVFNDKGVMIPMPDKQNVQIFIGFDEGPYNTK
ncbi:hypothetical protein H721_00505 [Brucella ovis IntaBari-2006-46-332]|uniref:Lipoprotein n=1 Tax=Brucella ovis (strain ATCC 25840 / 63/290 / NCTC 10512) TaxID=444178 RepID=A0A0H3APT2_BRUO2|nr:hypothetical protein [Brucella ovis]ABQ61528.1 putative lipoprotein [Brucella ovis ATCC 25840]ENR06470.1 hypothetical protein C010_00476 [Brucella ovis 80/125]ENR10261.1 hypothetical protein C961_00478 [Brucella ovis F8/05B]ENS96665.1 hypothetical protein B999_00815 [Brucella ovis 63/96]ENT01682.1 hypothetical protein C009_00494 [Brucella ovis 81/8]